MENTMPPPLLQDELREKTARLKNLEGLISVGRKDSDFDLFCRRMQMAKIFSSLPPEIFRQIYLTDFYTEFWKLANEYQRVTKFAEEEKNISRQVLEQARRETNPFRRQYFALLLIVFGELQEAQRLMDYSLWSQQLRQDFDTFAKWLRVANTTLVPQLREAIARNEQIFYSMQEKYSALIKKYSQAVINEKTCPPVQDYQIYFCWFQGEENLPPIVRCCYNSLKQNAGRYKIVFIDEKNFSNYVDIAPHIIDKFRAGKISRTNLSDILRINLLEQNGGLWLDATILVTEPLENHKELFEQYYFSQKFFHECDIRNPYSQFISYGRWTTAIQGTTILHNPLFAFGREFFNVYLHDFDNFIDYYLIDFMMALAYENIPEVRKEFDEVPINNVGIYFIQEHLNDSYAEFPFDKILRGNFLHKLSWKVPLDTTRTDTVFREIQRRYS